MTEHPRFDHPIQAIAAVRVATEISRTTILKACQKGPLKACSYESGDTWLIDTTSAPFQQWLAARPTQRRVKGQIMKQTILDAVWKREIDQMSTREVAEHFECSLVTARKVLLAIVNGTSGDSRFQPDTERGEGVLISDGSTFTYSPMDMDGSGSSLRTPKHYIWFCS